MVLNMFNNQKVIGVLTSGGDAPGMNAAIRAVVRMGKYYDMKVMGVRMGYNGLLMNNMIELKERDVSDILQRGGTFLGSARCLEFKLPENITKAVEIAKSMGIDGLVVIGGDGSFRGARDLSLAGLPTVGIPGTIDNDIDCTDYTIGFDTALNTVLDAIDKIRDTIKSHQRCNFIEVMGHKAGHIALLAGMAGGAECIIVPERHFDIEEDIIQQILDSRKRGKYHHIIIVAEGVGNTTDIAKYVENKMKAEYEVALETKVTILGHIQRGGSPTVTDRMIASRMGAHAVELLKNDIGNRVVVMKDNIIADYDILEALNMKKEIDDNLIALAKVLSR